MPDSVLENISKLGLNSYESKAYHALLRHSQALSCGDVADKTSIPRPRVYDILHSLEKKQLIVQQAGRPAKFKALEIERGFANIVAARQKGLAREIAEIKRIQKHVQENLTVKRQEKASEEGVWMLEGPAIYSTLRELIDKAQEHVVIGAGESEAASWKMQELESALMKARQRKVRIRFHSHSSVDREMQKKMGGLGPVSDNKHSARFCLIDHDRALIFLNKAEDKENQKAVLIHSLEAGKTFKNYI